jgi:hypothetical protein
MAIVFMGTINSSVDIPDIPSSLKKAQNTSDSTRVTVHSFHSPYNKQTIQEKSE